MPRRSGRRTPADLVPANKEPPAQLARSSARRSGNCVRSVEELERAVAEAEKAAKDLKEQLKHAKAVVEEARTKLSPPPPKRPTSRAH